MFCISYNFLVLIFSVYILIVFRTYVQQYLKNFNALNSLHMYPYNRSALNKLYHV